MLVFGLTKRLPTGGSCISNALRTGSVVRYITQVTHEKIFFNRKRELNMFRNAFNADPELHVILGPPSTGKTALIRQVVTNKGILGPPSTGKTALIREVVTNNKGNFKPLFLDCRSGQFDSPKNLYNSISMQFKPFFKEQKEFLKKILPETELRAMLPFFFDVNLKLFDKKEKEITSSNVIELLIEISSALPKWNYWRGYDVPPPILIVDEANLLSQLGDSSKEGAVLLKSFLNWLVINTKQENRFHAVLTSSDSFFLNWIINILHVPHATPYVVGDLTKEEAEEYFENHVLPRYECKELEGKFDRVCRITGTRMLIIDRYVNEYKILGEKLTDRRFSVSRLEYNKLFSGLVPFRSPDKPRDPLWNRDELIKVMKAVVDAENRGFVLEADLEREISREKIHSLVDYNLLHCRPTNNFAFDIIDPPDKVILTAMNKPSLRAMEHLLNDLGKASSSK